VRIPRCAIVVAILSAVFIVGCGGEDEAKPVDLSGKVDASAFEGMKAQMTKDLKAGNKAPKAETKPAPKE
jgi:hypothetical protein